MKKVLFSLFFLHFSYATIPQKVVLCGVCKDVALRIPFSMKIMEKIGSFFSDYRIIVYENNSSDTTGYLIQEWAKNNNKVHAISERVTKEELEKTIINRLENGDFFRPECIARARNIVLEKALSPEYEGYDYIIWMDMDFKTEPDYQAIDEIFASAREWDAVFAYGVDPRPIFWDWYALRDQECPLGSELLGNDWWYLPKELNLTVQDDWYPVYSAFGGCGIYKKIALKNCRYSALVTSDLAEHYKTIIANYPDHPIVQKYLLSIKNLLITTLNTASKKNLNSKAGIVIPHISEIVWRLSSFVYKYPSVCEHVTLHASMIRNGYDKLFINPRFIFRYGG